jgi:hypothetical protein
MGAGFSGTAFRIDSLFWQRAGPGRCQVGSFIPALLLAAILSGCASVDVLMLSSETFTPRTSTVEILERAPTRPYVQIAVLTVDSWWLSVDSRREKIVEKAAHLGADAVVFGDLRLSAPGPSNRTAEQSTPPPSLPFKDPEKVLPDDLHSSLQEGVLDADVMIYLVRGGGHGGSRRGGHGHWGGPSGPSGFRHWRHFRGPGYWGSGLYGPGWWGYGPYWGPSWGGYSPYSYYGGYPYPGYGYMNTFTLGTAIHYTD